VQAPKGVFKEGQKLKALVDLSKREATRANHTATHLLHSALRKVLGTHVQQAGSLVNEDKLRFDFSHNKAITPEQIEEIEAWVNAAIQKGVSLEVMNTSYDDAVKNKGALALFSEKYGDTVRVVSIPELSAELCGGLHVKNTSDIRIFKWLSDSAVAAGTRRVEALTGAGAMNYFYEKEALVEKISHRLKTPSVQLEDRIEKLLENQKKLESEIQELRRKILSGDSAESALEFKGAQWSFRIHTLDADADAKLLREKADILRQKESGYAHILLAGKSVLITADETKLKGFHSGDFLKSLTAQLGGRGGGQARTAQGSLETATADQLQNFLKQNYA
jgi:alanyl-tRNA synthetase